MYRRLKKKKHIFNNCIYLLFLHVFSLKKLVAMGGNKGEENGSVSPPFKHCSKTTTLIQHNLYNST
jgi:hypothetical protein